MPATPNPSGQGFVPLLLKGYLLGTVASAIVLHVAISIIAPGDGGTLLALGSGIILFMLLIMLGLIALVLFPLAAIASWPFRRLVVERPIWALLCASGVGVAVGAVATATEFQIGPGDFWSGPLVGLVYAAVWFFVIRSSTQVRVG
jgi:hypothetical protein